MIQKANYKLHLGIRQFKIINQKFLKQSNKKIKFHTPKIKICKFRKNLIILTKSWKKEIFKKKNLITKVGFKNKKIK